MTDKPAEKVSIKVLVQDPSNGNIATEWREINLESNKQPISSLLEMVKKTLREL
jgi:hypothetical protein